MEPLFLRLLDELERKEVQSLTWGYADGSYSRENVVKLASRVLNEARNDRPAEDLVEDLIDKKLIFEFGGRIRTRFAETLRLLVRLRQMFPGRPWQGSPRLVSDFRIDLRRRRYPQRIRNPLQIEQDHPAIFSTNLLRHRLWTALTGESCLKLAGFQERSIARILSSTQESGTIITAGTGSGKTMAFYLPALMAVADRVKVNEFWTKTLAVYPRNELLKDQFAEAYSQCRKLDHVLSEEGRRPILIGAYFGNTPSEAKVESLKEWPKQKGEFVCPWLKCPKCDSTLLWLGKDLLAQKEILHCSKPECGHVLPENTIVLTRKRLLSHIPDILFTTTEMLNQRMSDIGRRKLFGIGQAITKRPYFMLLDEVHTYSGTAGAQAALVLRRWRHLVAARVNWVGLSATLRGAPRFFSELTGLEPESIAEITPLDSEMFEEGAEYQIILRGDPTLQASLLSTSIQAAMLLGRAMDSPNVEDSGNYFGRRIFAFTDDLDVTNRLFDNLRDAEAYTIFGKEDPRKLPLAALRGEEPKDPRRDLDGQRWRFCEQINRKLDTRLIVGRTTSQDAGVLQNADVVIATAALEVGYNDDEVGAVLQHKAPKNMASFMQRKGRAGRKRGMRPFTVTILSEYGRDRVAYQAYEHLFDPVVPAQHLPVHNQYVLRMQTVFSFIDWIAEQCPADVKGGWLWDLLSHPTDYHPKTRTHIKKVLTGLIRGDNAYHQSLTKYLESSLKISRDVVNGLLWEPPRSLMLEVIPTLTRRFFRDWELAFPSNQLKLDLLRDYHPLPDFIPRALFSDLSLPEVQILLPPATANREAKNASLPILAAMLQLAPGRVTRRFAVERGGLNHWVKVSSAQDCMTMVVSDYAEQSEFIGIFKGQNADGEQQEFPVYRPWRIRLTSVGRNEALPTSTAFSTWVSAFEAQGEATIVDVPPHSAWFEFVSDVRFYMHHFRGSVAVRRFVNEVHASLRQLDGDRLIKVNYRDSNNDHAALGFELEVDGFSIDFKLPGIEDLSTTQLNTELEGSSRLAYFRYLFLSDKDVATNVNSLQREWIFQIFISAATTHAIKRNTTLGQAAHYIIDHDPASIFAEVLRILFQVRDTGMGWEEDEGLGAAGDEDGEEKDDSETRKVSRLEERLTESIARNDVLKCLKSIAMEMDVIDRAKYGKWLHQVICETLAQAVLQACAATSPLHASVDALVADIEVLEDESDTARIWVTETTLGGAGVVQAFAEVFSTEPRALFRALEAALASNDVEMASHGLKHFLVLACADEEIKALAGQARDAVSHEERSSLRMKLYAALSLRGLDVGHALSVSLNTRLLRQGTQPELYHLLHELLEIWEGIEKRLSISLGVREFSYLAIDLPKIAPRLQEVVVAAGGSSKPTKGDLIQVLEALLWPRGIEVRQKALHSYNPFRPRRISDPALIRAMLLARNVQAIDISERDWSVRFVETLAKLGNVELFVPRVNEQALRGAIMKAITYPIDVGYMQFYPIVERFERNEKESRVTLTLREYV